MNLFRASGSIIRKSASPLFDTGENGEKYGVPKDRFEQKKIIAAAVEKKKPAYPKSPADKMRYARKTTFEFI